jgi:PPK2 family polyphosphate:nucleotide phosphotransferase
MKLKSPYLVKPGTKVKLSSFKTDDTGDFKNSDAADPVLKKHGKRLDELQEVFYASQGKALLIVLQGMDTAGKDGTIRNIFAGINPQGCQVAAFKVPTSLEARHDFLWRCHLEVPPRGMIGVFNRSHYEDVLSPRVHGKLSKKQVKRHLDDINAWEKTLTDNDVVILKFFLHISHEEQTRRLQARIETPDKHWKLSPSDFEERRFWGDYMEAYEDLLRETSHKHAPWFVIPSDHKWYRNVAISSIIVEAMQGLKLTYPPPTFDPTGIDLFNDTAEAVAAQARKLANPASPNATEQKTSHAGA